MIIVLFYILTENIKWEHIEFKDNQEILDLLAAKPLNIISLIDEESRFPKVKNSPFLLLSPLPSPLSYLSFSLYLTQGTDLSMLKKLHTQHSKNPNYMKPKSETVHSFGIRHFAGNVWYSANGVLEKNRDTFSNDLFDLLHKSKSPFISTLFSGMKAMV